MIGQNSKSKSCLGVSDSDSDSDSDIGDVTGYSAITGYCTFPALIDDEDSSEGESKDAEEAIESKESPGVLESDSEEYEEAIDLQKEFKCLYENRKKTI